MVKFGPAPRAGGGLTSQRSQRWRSLTRCYDLSNTRPPSSRHRVPEPLKKSMESAAPRAMDQPAQSTPVVCCPENSQTLQASGFNFNWGFPCHLLLSSTFRLPSVCCLSSIRSQVPALGAKGRSWRSTEFSRLARRFGRSFLSCSKVHINVTATQSFCAQLFVWSESGARRRGRPKAGLGCEPQIDCAPGGEGEAAESDAPECVGHRERAQVKEHVRESRANVKKRREEQTGWLCSPHSSAPSFLSSSPPSPFPLSLHYYE